MRWGERLKTLYLGRMPESGKLTLKAQLASEVAHIRRARPEIGIVAIADGAADNWTFLETLSPETEVIDFWHACEHLQTASDHAVAPGWFERYREVLRHDPCGVDKVIRALRHLRDSAKPDRAEIERELAFFRKHRQRMRYHALKAEGRRHRLRRGRGGQQDPGDPAHEALRHALEDRRRTGCADLPRPDQIRSLRAGMEGHHRRNRHTGQRQHQSLCRHRHRCLNSMNEAPAINAIRDSHPVWPLLVEELRLEEVPMRSRFTVEGVGVSPVEGLSVERYETGEGEKGGIRYVHEQVCEMKRDVGCSEMMSRTKWSFSVLAGAK